MMTFTRHQLILVKEILGHRYNRDYYWRYNDWSVSFARELTLAIANAGQHVYNMAPRNLRRVFQIFQNHLEQGGPDTLTLLMCYQMEKVIGAEIEEPDF